MSQDQTEAYSRDEIRQKLFRKMNIMVDYWLNIPKDSVKDRMDGLVFTLLSTIDGSAVDLPAMTLTPICPKEDKEYFQSQGEKWYDESTDIAGELHSEWIRYAKDNPIVKKSPREFRHRPVPPKQVSMMQVNAAGLYLEHLGISNPFKAVPCIGCVELQKILTKPKPISCTKSLLGTLALFIEVTLSQMQEPFMKNTNGNQPTVRAVLGAKWYPSCTMAN